jgi:hypothetical protein
MQKLFEIAGRAPRGGAYFIRKKPPPNFSGMTIISALDLLRRRVI